MTKSTKYTGIVSWMAQRKLRELAKLRNLRKLQNIKEYVLARQINEIYLKGYMEGPSEFTGTAKFAKFTKTAIFTIICRAGDDINEIYC